MNCLVMKWGWRALPLLMTVMACSTEQPKTRCTTAHLPFALKYTKVEGTAAPCSELTGEIAGIQSYWRADSVEGEMPTVTRGGVAIRTNEVGALLAKYEQTVDTRTAAALGAFATDEPDAQGFCEVSMTKPSTLMLAAVPPKPAPGDAGGMTDPLPAVELTLEWSNVRFYVTAAQPGTMFSGRLKYTKNTGGQTCSATYDVAGLAPYVECEGLETVGGMERGTGKPNDDACHPCADSAKGRVSGSGISPGVDIACDADTLTCIPRSVVPSLRPEPLQCTE
jgi:hypothetical protein